MGLRYHVACQNVFQLVSQERDHVGESTVILLHLLGSGVLNPRDLPWWWLCHHSWIAVVTAAHQYGAAAKVAADMATHANAHQLFIF